jgi:hypothetical protein
LLGFPQWRAFSKDFQIGLMSFENADFFIIYPFRQPWLRHEIELITILEIALPLVVSLIVFPARFALEDTDFALLIDSNHITAKITWKREFGGCRVAFDCTAT